MSGVCAASDIWSVGCTVIELLTCVPPYYDLQPMPALFRIVRDEHPPVPDSLSSDITDFLNHCFKKDAKQRPDAKMLLSHPWIQNCGRALQSSLRRRGTLRNMYEDDSADAEATVGDHNSAGQSSSMEKEDFAKEFSNEAANRGKPDEEFSNQTDDFPSDPVLTIAIHEKSSQQAGSSRLSSNSNKEVASSGYTSNLHISNAQDQEEAMMNGEVGYPQPIGKGSFLERKRSSIKNINNPFCFGTKDRDDGSIEAINMLPSGEGHGVSRFSDPPGDACLEDLFHPLNKQLEKLVVGASASISTSYMDKGNASIYNGKNNDLAKELRDTISRKQREKEKNNEQENSGGNLFHLLLKALKEDVIDIDGSIYDDKFPGDNIFPYQTAEFSKLVGSLKPEEPEDVIVSACQKLISIFHQRPEQKIVFVTQHGLLPLTDLLEAPATCVICYVLQLINQIIKDNTKFQENACLVGLIPLVMTFAVPEHTREIRMEAAYFFQHLFQSSSLTLQMFVACGGIPVLVGFLESDYAKYREMVHLAIDGMWQVFTLQRSTLRNDFCRIAAKNGILLRLINTLYSLNEATRLVSVNVRGDLLVESSAQQPCSDPLDSTRPSTIHNDGLVVSSVDQQDLPNMSHEILDNHLESSHASTSNPRRSDGNNTVDEMLQSRTAEAEIASLEKNSNLASWESSDGALTEQESVDHWKYDPSRANVEPRLQPISIYVNKTSTSRPLKLTEHESNVLSETGSTQQEQSRSGQLKYGRQFSGLLKSESVLHLLQSSKKKSNSELDILMEEFAVSRCGRENGNLDTSSMISNKFAPKKVGSFGSNQRAASTYGIVSQTSLGRLSGSGVLNTRPSSATSSHMVSSLNADVAKEYQEKVADLILEFAQADTTVKSYMCIQGFLSRLFQMFNGMEPAILLKILKCVNHLSTDPNCLDNLQRADAIRYLIPNLELREGSLVSQIHHEVLNTLFNLCKINKRRQEQASENGIIPHLMQFITSNSPLKQYALPLLCDMAHSSRNSREQLTAHGCLDAYLNLLEDKDWSVTALDSIAVCIAHDNDNRKVEQALLKKDAVQKLVKFFQFCPEQYFVHILEPFWKIITKSARINTALAINGLTPLLIARLNHQDAIARLNLLKLIKAVYEHHPQPKKLIVENDLPQKLQNLIGERRDGQVLVKQMATSLLKALHINTVL
ncbi:PREDICTED: MAP3K epsilon protein kinase 1-like isoform X2 [Lupinus angustifolius]|uniref:MAP3K epsilon protein kinase 1-like isoform X2 n=1 Tax=Lupinus angustifolius TaxID=3871 RepID=UPI00092F93AB|nr:PREDICTED: MAP3K epsilon protein kinase 1-like isoform X2 [Lupinus angustifolius]